MDENRIVVGVDGGQAAVRAVQWAAQESLIRGCELLVIHGHGRAGGLAANAGPGGGPRRDAVLDAAASIVASDWPAVPVRTLLSDAEPAQALVTASRAADLVVLGTNGQDDIARSLFGTVGQQVATRAHCPVVIVPDEPSSPRREGTGNVLVGLAPTPTGWLALGVALEEGRLHRCPVIGVRAGVQAHTIELDDLIGAAARLAPDVPFGLIESGAATVPGLLDEAGRSRMLVLGCHHEDLDWSSRVGPLPAAMLANPPCPVMLVGRVRPAHQDRRDDQRDGPRPAGNQVRSS